MDAKDFNKADLYLEGFKRGNTKILLSGMFAAIILFGVAAYLIFRGLYSIDLEMKGYEKSLQTAQQKNALLQAAIEADSERIKAQAAGIDENERLLHDITATPLRALIVDSAAHRKELDHIKSILHCMRAASAASCVPD